LNLDHAIVTKRSPEKWRLNPLGHAADKVTVMLNLLVYKLFMHWYIPVLDEQAAWQIWARAGSGL